jgi:hypothetical protein
VSARKADDKNRDKVRGVDVEPGETVVLVARPSRAAVWYRYLISLGFYGFWRRRDVSVLTDRRLLMGKGILRRTERSIPLHNINDVVYLRKVLFAYCEISAIVRGFDSVFQIGPLSIRQARRFTQEVQGRR